MTTCSPGLLTVLVPERMAGMATQIMSDEELERLHARVPRDQPEELVRYFTLTPADEGFLAGHRRPANRLGLAVQLCTLPWLGFVPDDVASTPAQAVARLAGQLGVSVEDLPSAYTERGQTRTDHLGEVVKFLRWRQAGEVERKELGQFLAARAMEHDSPSVLFRLACEYLRTSRVVRPVPTGSLARSLRHGNWRGPRPTNELNRCSRPGPPWRVSWTCFS